MSYISKSFTASLRTFQNETGFLCLHCACVTLKPPGPRVYLVTAPQELPSSRHLCGAYESWERCQPGLSGTFGSHKCRPDSWFAVPVSPGTGPSSTHSRTQAAHFLPVPGSCLNHMLVICSDLCVTWAFVSTVVCWSHGGNCWRSRLESAHPEPVSQCVFLSRESSGTALKRPIVQA